MTRLLLALALVLATASPASAACPAYTPPPTYDATAGKVCFCVDQSAAGKPLKPGELKEIRATFAWTFGAPVTSTLAAADSQVVCFDVSMLSELGTSSAKACNAVGVCGPEVAPYATRFPALGSPGKPSLAAP